MQTIARPAALLAAVSILLASCSLLGYRPGGTIAHPGSNDLVLRVEYRGGFVPVQWLFSSFPSFALVGDGRVFAPGAVPAIFPGPALPAVLVRGVTPSGIQAILEEVLETGVFAASADYRGAANFVADASDTVFTLHADGREVTVSVYALGIFEFGGIPDAISKEEQAVHRTLTALLRQLETLDEWLEPDDWADAAWRSYQPAALRLLVRNADGDPPQQDGITGEIESWPVTGDPAAFGKATPLGEGYRCGVVSGAEAEAWYRALADANQLTRWSGGGHAYEVIPRFMLPYEPLDCLDVLS